MEKVPQIVSERLRAASSSVGHPDPDVLTAFSEHSLRKSERAAVVEHLARCGVCREIVALALPPSDQLQETVRPASESWLTWPVLRWGFIAAGVVAIASFGIMQYQRHSSMMAEQVAAPETITKEARNLPPAPLPAAPAEHQDETKAAPSPTTADRKDLSSQNAAPAPSAKMAVPALSGPLQSKRAVVGGALPHGPRVQWQQNTNQQQAAQVPAKQVRSVPLPSGPPSASPETTDVESATGMVSANLDSSAVHNKIDQQALQHGLSETKVERIKPPATTIATAAPAAAAFPAPNSPAKSQLIAQSAQAASVSNISILWTITATGRLQRSLDQGTTWQDIDVNSPSAASGAGLELTTATSKAQRITADNLAKKVASAPLVFRAIASNGADVWAGASGGFLYHSTDAGGRWARVIPSASGVSLTGDIVSLEFADPQNGRVMTSIPEVWTTSDAGQSWQKQ